MNRVVLTDEQLAELGRLAEQRGWTTEQSDAVFTVHGTWGWT